MRIRVFSDLHLEFGSFDPPRVDADVAILAGDIWYADQGIRWAATRFQPDRTVCLLGNHEFYKGEIEEIVERCRIAAQETGVRFLENDSIVLDGVRFIGSTLWADFRLYGGGEQMIGSMKAAARYINDFRLIQVNENGKSRRLKPADVVYRNRAATRFIENELGKPFSGKTVVVTHFPPSRRSIAPKYIGDSTAPYYCAELDGLIETAQPDLWIHGHTHESFDYHIGRTRIICNPRGYHPHHLNANFDPELAIEL